MKYRMWDVITASETYLKPGEMVAQLLDFSQMQYGSRDDRQLLHSRQKPDRRLDIESYHHPLTEPEHTTETNHWKKTDRKTLKTH